MGHKDIISKRILKNLVKDFATYLFDLPVAYVELVETEQQRVEDRRSDLVAKARLLDGEAFLLHIEIQNANDPAMPLRMLRYLTDMLMKNRDMPWRQYVVYIGKERLGMADGLEGSDLSYRYRIIDMHNLDCDDFLRQDSPDAWVLAILCDFKNRLPRDVIHSILARLVERYADNPPRLREYVDMLDILGTNRDLNIDIGEELKMLTIDVEKLATYRIGMEKGMEKGMENGMKAGQQKGAKEQAIVIAKNLLDMGMTATQVVAATGLSLPEVEVLTGEQVEGREGKKV